MSYRQESNKSKVPASVSTVLWFVDLGKLFSRDCTSVYVDYTDLEPMEDSVLTVCWKETIVHYHDLPKPWKKLIRKTSYRANRKERLRQIAKFLQNTARRPCYCSLYQNKGPYGTVSYVLYWDIQRGDYSDLALENQVKVKSFLVDAEFSISNLEKDGK